VVEPAAGGLNIKSAACREIYFQWFRLWAPPAHRLRRFHRSGIGCRLGVILAERFAILCAATNWTGPARVARELVRHGAEVCIVAPPDSIVALTRYKTADLLLPLDEINRTLPGVLQVLAEQFGARTVLAGDTAAFLLLAHQMSAASRLKLDSKTEAMLRRSMPAAALGMNLTRASDIAMRHCDDAIAPTPASIANPSPDAAIAFAWKVGFPVLVKRNGYEAGEGIARCNDEAALAAELARPPPNARDRDFIVQKHVTGAVYGVAVAGSEGKAAGAFVFEKHVLNPPPHGPASVLRYADRPLLAAHARSLFEAYGMNGYAGVDYIVDESGRAFFLEINPCIVPKSHLTCFGANLTGAMLAMLRGDAPTAAMAPTHELVAMFPNEWRRDPDSPFLSSALHDVPWDDPGVLGAMRQRLGPRLGQGLNGLAQRNEGAGNEPNQREHEAAETDQHRWGS
jgi:hypothetical protein